MILELLVLASLLRVDPAGDAYGAGDLVPPSAALYADLSPFDLIDVEAGGDEELTIRVRLAGIPDPGGLPNGLTLPVVDVYLDLADGGAEAALPGVGMAFPAGRGWEIALRLHGDRAYLVRADDPTRRERPVTVARRGDVLTVATGLPAPEEIRDLQAVTGVYDPFSSDAWRPLASLPSPWAFASEVPAPPVVDLLAESDEVQREAIRSYVLPPSRNDRGPVGWLLAMFVGLGLAAAGLWLRRHVPLGDTVPPGGADAPGDAVPDAETVPPDATPTPEAAPLEPIDASELEADDADERESRDAEAAGDRGDEETHEGDSCDDDAGEDDAAEDDAAEDDAAEDDAAEDDAGDAAPEGTDDDAQRPPHA